MRWGARGTRSSARERGLHDLKRTRAQYGPSMLVQPFTNRLGGAGHVQGTKALERVAQHGPRARRAAHPHPQILDHRRRLAALAEDEYRTPCRHIVEQLSGQVARKFWPRDQKENVARLHVSRRIVLANVPDYLKRIRVSEASNCLLGDGRTPANELHA
jgi:hypothetical protein